MRARGANARLRVDFETTYGTPPSSNFKQVPFVSSDLGPAQGLIESDLLGQGREGEDATLDVINNDGNLVVPVDVRNFGYWLALCFGEPVTTGLAKAGGSIVFSAQPAVNSTITLAGTAFTFVSGSPSGNQIQIGASLTLTLDNAVTALNGSAVPAIAAATYSKTGTDTLTILHDTTGTVGNAFTLAASSSPASHGTPSGATLTGGTNKHVFTSGADDLPSMSIETGLEDISKFEMNYGARANTLRIEAGRRGLLNATLGLVAKGAQAIADASDAGTPTVADTLRFAQATGSIEEDDVVLAHVVQASIMYSNNLDKVETIRADSEIEDADPGMSTGGGNLTVRVADDIDLDSKATGRTPVKISVAWAFQQHSLKFIYPRCLLPRPKRTINGPAGIQASFDFQASGADGTTCQVELVNDVAAYDLP